MNATAPAAEKIVTPARDALKAQEADLRATINGIREEQAVILMRSTVPALKEIHRAEVVGGRLPSGKEAIAYEIADERADKSTPAKALAALQRAAKDEASIIDAIHAAAGRVEKAKAKVEKALSQSGPEYVIDASKEWEQAIYVSEHWRSVRYLVVKEQQAPAAALLTVVHSVMSDLAMEFIGAIRSTDDTRNMLAAVQRRAATNFLREARRYSREVSEFVRF